MGLPPRTAFDVEVDDEEMYEAVTDASGILSIDISDWDKPGVLFGKPAKHCTAVEIKDEVWAQLKMHLNGFGAPAIEDDNLLDWFLDPDIEFPNPSMATNAEP